MSLSLFPLFFPRTSGRPASSRTSTPPPSFRPVHPASLSRTQTSAPLLHAFAFFDLESGRAASRADCRLAPRQPASDAKRLAFLPSLPARFRAGCPEPARGAVGAPSPRRVPARLFRLRSSRTPPCGQVIQVRIALADSSPPLFRRAFAAHPRLSDQASRPPSSRQGSSKDAETLHLPFACAGSALAKRVANWVASTLADPVRTSGGGQTSRRILTSCCHSQAPAVPPAFHTPLCPTPVALFAATLAPGIPCASEPLFYRR